MEVYAGGLAPAHETSMPAATDILILLEPAYAPGLLS
jgi:hypothetical protein